MKWYIKVMKNYLTFDGRARRIEYWMFVLFNALFCIAAIILDNLLGLNFSRTVYGVEVGMYYGWIYTIYGLVVLLPSFAVGVRRLHDIGKSGWLLLVSLIPIVGGIILLVFMCTNGQIGENQYGPDPKGEEVQ
ncbi:MAG: DUF805 domain-containing protein [Bacteroidales bacterium]|nr:DUF805 domain-containing protein [Bacteroidales bacterium]